MSTISSSASITRVKLNPALAESYEISDDGLLITLKIRQGVTYHSGNPMTTEDVVANLEVGAERRCRREPVAQQHGCRFGNPGGR